jgi:hypothetical protein
LGVITPHQRRFYLGNADGGYIFQAASDPGVDPITLSVVDAVPASGQPASAIKLATTQAGLAGAVAAPLWNWPPPSCQAAPTPSRSGCSSTTPPPPWPPIPTYPWP